MTYKMNIRQTRLINKFFSGTKVHLFCCRKKGIIVENQQLDLGFYEDWGNNMQEFSNKQVFSSCIIFEMF